MIEKRRGVASSFCLYGFVGFLGGRLGRSDRLGRLLIHRLLVHRLLADETIDERMLEILSGKQKEFDSFADDSVVGDGQLAAESGEGSWVTQMVRQEQERLQNA